MCPDESAEMMPSDAVSMRDRRFASRCSPSLGSFIGPPRARGRTSLESPERQGSPFERWRRQPLLFAILPEPRIAVKLTPRVPGLPAIGQEYTISQRLGPRSLLGSPTLV